eukprot:TRINITY_DN85118_c0_g1_i1.p1 TRINITY_DN85118_c0_g1~~TRINITY_DN85118_c0_g1_i1.p1  ORF type:complete len:477 (-),score=89.97 TRINITY_DN85118_c0_g1_i1:109-1491(-)
MTKQGEPDWAAMWPLMCRGFNLRSDTKPVEAIVVQPENPEILDPERENSHVSQFSLEEKTMHSSLEIGFSIDASIPTPKGVVDLASEYKEEVERTQKKRQVFISRVDSYFRKTVNLPIEKLKLTDTFVKQLNDAVNSSSNQKQKVLTVLRDFGEVFAETVTIGGKLVFISKETMQSNETIDKVVASFTAGVQGVVSATTKAEREKAMKSLQENRTVSTTQYGGGKVDYPPGVNEFQNSLEPANWSIVSRTNLHSITDLIEFHDKKLYETVMLIVRDDAVSHRALLYHASSWLHVKDGKDMQKVYLWNPTFGRKKMAIKEDEPGDFVFIFDGKDKPGEYILDGDTLTIHNMKDKEYPFRSDGDSDTAGYFHPDNVAQSKWKLKITKADPMQPPGETKVLTTECEFTLHNPADNTDLTLGDTDNKYLATKALTTGLFKAGQPFQLKAFFFLTINRDQQQKTN